MSKSKWIIEQWSVTSQNNPYIPPEFHRTYIQGICPNRPGFEKGICTSAVVKIDGRQIVTESGSHYTLGTPDAEYVEECKNRGWHVPTENEPLKLVKI